MAYVNFSTREILVKVVYYGPGLGGKTTSLQFIYNSLPQTHRGKMISLATDEDRTIYFDFLPVYLGKLQGFTVRLQLYTVPGQVRYNQTRRLVLKGVDGIVFVADLQKHRKFANVESMQNAEENLQYYGLKLEDIPHVIQYNKIDLPNIISHEELDPLLNKYQASTFCTCAVTGENVLDALTQISKLVFDDLRRKGLKTATRADTEKEIQPSAEPPTQEEAVEVVDDEVEIIDEAETSEEISVGMQNQSQEKVKETVMLEDDDIALIEPETGSRIPVPDETRLPPLESLSTVESPASLLESENEVSDISATTTQESRIPMTEWETRELEDQEKPLEESKGEENILEWRDEPITPMSSEHFDALDTDIGDDDLFDNVEPEILEVPETSVEIVEDTTFSVVEPQGQVPPSFEKEPSTMPSQELSPQEKESAEALETQLRERLNIPQPQKKEEGAVLEIQEDWWRKGVPPAWVPLWEQLQDAWNHENIVKFLETLKKIESNVSERWNLSVDTLLPEGLKLYWRVCRRRLEHMTVWEEQTGRLTWYLTWSLGWLMWQQTLEDDNFK